MIFCNLLYIIDYTLRFKTPQPDKELCRTYIGLGGVWFGWSAVLIECGLDEVWFWWTVV